MKKIVTIGILISIMLVACQVNSSNYAINTAETLTFQEEKTYDYKHFDWNQIFDTETGYLKNIKAVDYVDIPDLHTLQVAEADIMASKQEITLMLENYIKTSAIEDPHIQTTNRKCKLGDIINLDYSGKVDGVTFVGGTAKNAVLELGSGTFIAGFEEQIVNHMPNEDFEITVTFPKGYGNAQDNDGNTIILSEAKANFSIHLNYIEELNITDEWVTKNLKETFNLTTKEELISHIKNIISQQKQIEVSTKIMEEQIKVKEIPNSLIDYLATSILYLANEDANAQNITLEEFLSKQNIKTQAELLNQYAETIKSHAKQYLIFQAIAETYNINTDITIKDTDQHYIDTYGIGVFKNRKLCISAIDYFSQNITIK